MGIRIVLFESFFCYKFTNGLKSQYNVKLFVNKTVY